MKYKALLLDIDNTLYDYNATHAIAKKSSIEYCKTQFNIDKTACFKKLTLLYVGIQKDSFIYFKKGFKFIKSCKVGNILSL